MKIRSVPRGIAGNDYTAVYALFALSKQETSQVGHKNHHSSTPATAARLLRFYTPNHKPRGYSFALRQQAVAMAADGHSNRSIARALHINHQTVANWVKAAATKAKSRGLPMPPTRDCERIAELDKRHTFVGQKSALLPCHPR